MSAEFRIEGLDELDKQFDRLADTSKKKVMRKALNAGIAPIKKEAKRLAPVNKGVLKKSIRSKQMRFTAKPAVGLFIGGKGFYWYFLENGTSSIAPTPFIRPAADSKHEEGVERFKDVLKAEIDKVMIG
ncbi:HK97-gp10 family putative phage morphogenesis protein [Psychrobacter sp. AT9]|uniref:HK97-gp10 family putative phage morphogenesis protein n=1 Tax=Psychrobacter sp. AT9 TaxID=3242893 RepID=UPI0039A5A6C1